MLGKTALNTPVWYLPYVCRRWSTHECARARVTTRGPSNCLMKPADTSLNYVLAKKRTARAQWVEEIAEGLGWAHAMTYWRGNVTCNRHTFNQREQACVLSEPSNWDAPCTENGGRSPTVELHTKWVTLIYCWDIEGFRILIVFHSKICQKWHRTEIDSR